MEGVQSESTPSFSSKKIFVVSNDNPSNEPSQRVFHPKKLKNVVMDEIVNKEVEGEELLTFS
jgi:hypothetical protein